MTKLEYPRLLLFLALAVVMPITARAQIDSREGIALQNQIYQLRQELSVLRDRGGPAGSGMAGADVVGQLLSRVQAMEEQVRQLRGRIDETQNMLARQNADLAKRIDDLTFQMNLASKGASVSPPAMPMPAPPPVREVAPRPAPLPDQIVSNDPMRGTNNQPRLDLLPKPPPFAPLPSVTPPPQSAPPVSFTFNPAPDPMREFPPSAPPRPAIRPPEPPKPPVEAITTPPKPAVLPSEAPPKPVVEAMTTPPRPPPRPPEPPRNSASDAMPLAPLPTEISTAVPDPSGKRTPEMALQEGHAALARRDYATAEHTAREVMVNRASPRAYDGQFLLAEALAGQKQFAQAAIAFDDAYNRSHKGRYAQESLVGLASALTSINEKKAACDTLGKLRVEFPQVRADLKDVITRTNDRAGCARAGG
jgi:TolA-binding protein